MVQIKDATDKLKKIVAGATLMAGIAMGTGCDNATQTQKNPTEDVVNDTDNDYIDDANTDKPVENNDTDKPTENNDTDKPIENNDADKPVENNDTDKPAEHDDSDKPIDDEDKPIENNDNDDIINDDDTDINNPDETNDDDAIPDECADGYLLFTADQLETHSPSTIQNSITETHKGAKSYCPNGSFTEKEIYTTKGDLCIKDECIVNFSPDKTLWIDDLILKTFIGAPAVPPPHQVLNYKKIERLNNGNPTDLTIRLRSMTVYIKDVPTTSCFLPDKVVENASINTMIVGEACYSGDQPVSTSGIVTKNIQPKFTDSEFETACNRVPNSTYSQYHKKCYTTINEFAWLENVIPYLHNKGYAQWDLISLNITEIEKDWDNNTFYVYLSADNRHEWVVELPNAKRCLDECYGIEGCEVSINPSADISNGCKVKEPENASLIRPNTKTKTPLMAKQKNHARVDMKKLPKRNLTVSRVAQSLARRYTR